MKYGFRTPSLKKRIAARTSWKRVVRHSMGIKAPRGWGWLTNPRKAAYNRVYNRTTADPIKFFFGSRKRRSSSAVVRGRKSSGFGAAGLLIVIFFVWVIAKIGGANNSSSIVPSSRLIPPAQPRFQTSPVVSQAAEPRTPSSNVKPTIAVAPSRFAPSPSSLLPPAASDAVMSSTPQSLTLQDQLREAQAVQQIARSKLAAAQDGVKSRVALSSEYQQAKRQADEAKARVASLRASGGDGLAEASQTWMRVSSVPNRLLLDAATSDTASRLAQDEYNAKTSVVVSLQKQLADQQRLAALKLKQDAQDVSAAQQPSMTDSDTGTVSRGTGGYSGSSGGVKDEHVSGYTRKDGTHVNSYNRRSK